MCILCIVYPFVVFLVFKGIVNFLWPKLNHFHSICCCTSRLIIYYCLRLLSFWGGSERRHRVFCHVGQWPMWRRRLPSQPVHQRQEKRVFHQTPPPWKPPQRVCSGSEGLAVWASLQCVSVRARETEPVWTDAFVCVTGEHKTWFPCN